MSGQLGCVLAIRNRPADVLERTLQTYAYQTLAPRDRLLLDYGSELAASEAYRHLCREYGWRLVTHSPRSPRWNLSDAYNRAVSLLDEGVVTVFKSDVDILLGRDVLETAAVLGQKKLCLFSYLTARQGASYPARFTDHQDLIALLNSPEPPEEMPGEGVQAFPRQWFREIGGYDLAFEGWGFEDSDLRERAKWSIGLSRVPTALLIHQWHPQTISPEEARRNRAHYERMKHSRQLVRNGGALSQDQTPAATVVRESPRAVAVPTPGTSGRIAVVTRSMNEHLYQVSSELLGLERMATASEFRYERHRQTGTDSLQYFGELLRHDVDWVVNIDEDAFVLHPEQLPILIRFMDRHGFAACGMPDGGVVAIRQHNPIACNGFFNVFDLRRVRPVWQAWDRVRSATHRPAYEDRVADFARRTPHAFDHFERYYGVFFSLLEAGERILYLDATEWQDEVSTLLKDQSGQPLLIHCWYTRNWHTSHHTRRRYQAVIDHARTVQEMAKEKSQPCGAADERMSGTGSSAGKWDNVYRLQESDQPYGETLTYDKAAQFLADMGTVEDWGCGWGWFRKHLKNTTRYRGIDGSPGSNTDEVVDLARYTSRVEGILLRHVLEHNLGWEAILANAVRSFTRRMVLVLFTPFSEETRVIGYNNELGVPDLSFAKGDLTRHFGGLEWRLEENLRTRTQYGVEHVFYLEKRSSADAVEASRHSRPYGSPEMTMPLAPHVCRC